MTRKQILLLQLAEIRNEFADALDGLGAGELTAVAVPGRNTIVWIVCHCLRTIDRVLHEGILGRRCLGEGMDRHAVERDEAGLSAEQLSTVIGEADQVFAACIAAVAPVEEAAFAEPLPKSRMGKAMTVAGGCVLMINHCNAHLRQIWLMREALGDRSRWPVQTISRGKAEGEAEFVVASRQRILDGRANRGKAR